METQAVALMRPEYMTDLTARLSHFKMKENFVFIPKYHVSNLYTESGYDLKRLVIGLYTSDWGVWSPIKHGQFFIQSLTLRPNKETVVRIILARDTNERKTVYVYREVKQYRMDTLIDAAVCCYMCDMDDDGEFYSGDIGNELIYDIEYLDQ